MKHIARLWENMLARRTLSMVLCLALAVTSGGVCIASTNNLVQETRGAGEEEEQPEAKAETKAASENVEASSESTEMEGEILEDDTKADEPEDTRCIHEFTATWVGYECKLTDFVEGYEPGDEVRISVSFNKTVTSQIGLYIDGVWNSFRGEGRKRNITLVPDSDYLNIQISDLKGQASVNLTEVSAEIVRKGEADTGSYLHKFTGLWQGFETKFSDFNPDYQPGDEIRVTVNYSKYVSSQLGMNIGGEWSTLTGDGKELVREMVPDNDYLNIQITDMWANYKIGIISISVDILKKGPGVSGYGGGGGRLAATQYKAPGDYVLFSGEANGKYETNDGWILDCADTDWITLKYSCVPEHENWGILGWGATVDGQWVDGPGYSADSSDSTKEVTQTFSVKYLRKMMKITPESNVSYLNLGSYSDGRIEELALHVGSEIPREDSLFKDGAPNEPWNCTDIERILDAPDDKYLCVQYTCATPDFEGWTVLSWGASVNGEWRKGKSYKVSVHEATRIHSFSMRMDVFRNMLHLNWDAKIDSIQLAAYNDARILDIWIADDKLEDAGDSKKDKIQKEGGYSSPNRPTYEETAREEGYEYPQNALELAPWGWGDIAKADEICKKLKEGAYIVVEYEAETSVEPSLQFTMKDGKRQGVTPTYLTRKQNSDPTDGIDSKKTVKQAIFSYEDIQSFLPDYLIPEEIDYIQISSGDGDMTIPMIRVVTNNKKLEEEPIAVLTSSWSGYSTQLSKWHSDYQVGDTVKVTATFDKAMPGALAFNINGKWNCGGYSSARTVSRTARPSDDYVGIQLGAMPETKSFAKIMDIKVEIAGKPNFNDYVEVTGNRSSGILASTKKEAATAVLNDSEINKGVRVNFVVNNGALSEAETAEIKALFGEQADGMQVAKVSDITVYKADGTRKTKVTDTDEPVSFKVPVPDDLKNKGYDFATVRIHEGRMDYLEDLDGNPDTVTFASSKFSKFAIVCGEAGVFDTLSGAVKIFRSEWNGWDTSFQKYYSKYKPGKETKVTLTFDKDVRAYVDYHRPDWTRVEGSSIGRTFTTTITPGDDSLGIGIADLNGNSTVKLINVKVEQDEGKIVEFTAANQKYTTSFSAYNEMFVKGYPVTLKLTYNQEVTGGFSYHKNGSLEEVEESGNTSGKVLTRTFTPGDNELKVWVSSMNGNSSVKLVDIEVEQKNVPAIHTFKNSWGGNGDTYHGKISDLCDFEQGDKVRITAVFNKSSQVKMMVTGTDNTLTGMRVNFTAIPGDDGFDIQAGDDSKLPLGLLDVTAEVVEKAQPIEGLHRFMAAWAGFESKFSDYNRDFEPGKETTVTLTFDKDVKAQIGHNAADGYTNADGREYSKTLTRTVTPKDDYMNIQITDMNGNTAVNLLSVKVEQDTAKAIHEFKEAWSGFETTFGEFNSKYAPGKATSVTLTFDKAIKAQVGYHTKPEEGWESKEGTGKEITILLDNPVPPDDYMNIQVTDMDGNATVSLLAVKVEQKEETLHEFTGQWAGFETTFSRYNPDYEPGKATAVTVVFDKEVKAQVAYHTTVDSGWETKEGTGKEVTVVLDNPVPPDDYLNIQIADMNGNSLVNLMEVRVEQKEEPLHEYTEAWAGFETTFGRYNQDYEPGKATAVTVVFDKEVKAQVAYHTTVDSGWETKEGTGKEVTVVLDNPVPPDDYLNIQIADMNGNSLVNLMEVRVEQKEEPLHEYTEAWAGFETTFGRYNQDYEPGKATAVTVVFDKEVKAQVAYHTTVDSGWETKEGTGKEVTVVLDNPVPPDDYLNIQIADMNGNSIVKLLSVEITQDTQMFSLDDYILAEDPVHMFTEPETVILDLADYYDEYEAGQGVAVDMNLFSDGMFYAIVEDADLIEEVEKATDSNAKPVTEVLARMAAKASPFDATPSNAAKYEAEDEDVYKCDEEGMLNIQWEGNPKSGAIAVTILEMDGTQVNIDNLEVKERAGAVSVRNAFIEAAKKMVAENFPPRTSEPEKTDLSLNQEPAKKEEPEDSEQEWDDM